MSSMRTLRFLCLFLIAAGLFGLSARAQIQSNKEPRVRRASPVSIRRAEPLQSLRNAESGRRKTEGEGVEENSVGKDLPGERRQEHLDGSSEPVSRSEPDVSNPKEAADKAYARKLYDFAIAEYERFLASTSTTQEGRDAALFRLAESFLAVNKRDAAQRNYETLLAECQHGEFVSAGAYRLGELFLENKQYEAAASNFGIAAKEAIYPAINASALYLAARSFHSANKQSEALIYYEKVIADSGNLYRPQALLAAADIANRQKDTDKALSWYQEAARCANPAVSAQAAVQAAMILASRDQLAEARQLFLRVRTQAKDGQWRALAEFGMIELDYREKNYQALTKLSDTHLTQVPAEAVPRALLIVANANRLRNQYVKALQLYDRIISEWPSSDQAKDAAFERLICLYNIKDKNLLTETDIFLQKNSDSAQWAQAQLLKAETLFAAHDYPNAARAYQAARDAALPKSLLAEALYKQAWSLAQAKDYMSATGAYSDFLASFPQSDLVPNVILQRGIAYQNAGNVIAAMKDFDRLINDYPSSSDRELAMLQKALILGAENKNDEMRHMFQTLLAAYPKTNAAAQAEFWIGWSLFEEMRYKDALEHLIKARKLDSEHYGERASLRILLANYYLENVLETIKEAKDLPTKNVPPEIFGWIASKSLEANEYTQAERYLDLFINSQTFEAPPANRFLQLAEVRVKLGKYQSAMAPVDKYLEYARTPRDRAQGLLVKAEVALGNRQFEISKKLVEEALLLQPEGPLNAKGRLLSGRIFNVQGKYDEAAKIFMAVAVLYDDPGITPDALKLAADAYKKANNLVESRNAVNELEKRYPSPGLKVDGAKRSAL